MSDQSSLLMVTLNLKCGWFRTCWQQACGLASVALGQPWQKTRLRRDQTEELSLKLLGHADNSRSCARAMRWASPTSITKHITVSARLIVQAKPSCSSSVQRSQIILLRWPHCFSASLDFCLARLTPLGLFSFNWQDDGMTFFVCVIYFFQWFRIC